MSEKATRAAYGEALVELGQVNEKVVEMLAKKGVKYIATRSAGSDHVDYAAVKKYGEQSPIPVVLHLDHGRDFDSCVAAIEGGYTSVMIDGSKLSFEGNVDVSARVVAVAHPNHIPVEAELGKLAGVEDDVKVEAHDAMFTSPDEVEEFTSRTGIDSLAIAIGTSHGAYKFKPGQDPKLRIDILEEIGKRLPGFPIVLHGASSVPQDQVAIINQYGGCNL